MGMRLGADYAEYGFAPRRWGWEESAAEVHVPQSDIARLQAEGYALHTWTHPADQTVTLAMKGDHFIHSAYLNGRLLGTNIPDIEYALDILESPPRRPHAAAPDADTALNRS